MIAIVCGGRDYMDRDHVFSARIHRSEGPAEVALDAITPD